MEQLLQPLFPLVALWIAFCGTVFIVNRQWATRLAWLPLRLTRRFLAWSLRELANAIGGKGKK